MDKTAFVQKVKMICLMKDVKPTNACKESGVGGSFINDIERGRIPSVERVQMLAAYLGVTTSELLGEEKGPTPVPEELPGLSELRRIYCSLNDEGREKLLDYGADLEASGRYIKSGPDKLGKAQNG